MKTKLLALSLVVASLTAFAQGKILLGNDSLHLITDVMLRTLNPPPGTPIPQVYGWTSLTMQLYAGTTAGSMTLQTTIVGNAIGNPAIADGRIDNRAMTLTGVGTSVTAFLQIVFFDTSAGSYSNAWNGFGIYRAGATPVFTVTTGAFAFNSIVLHGPPGNSTWPDTPIPEPSVAALAGVGILLLRRYGRRS